MGVYERIETVAEVVMGGGPTPTGVLFERAGAKKWRCTLSFRVDKQTMVEGDSFGFVGSGETPEEAFEAAWKAFDAKCAAMAAESAARLERVRRTA